jgi:Ras family
VLVYDVTRRETFENVKTWLEEVDMYSTNADIVKMLGILIFFFFVFLCTFTKALVTLIILFFFFVVFSNK